MFTLNRYVDNFACMNYAKKGLYEFYYIFR